MLIFDPAALPDDYDRRMRDDPLGVIKLLADEGRIFWLNTHADGAYSLGVCLDGQLPSRHAAFARQLGVAERFAASGGSLYFAGIEYAFRHDDSFLRKHPHMGSLQKIAAGDYRLTIYEIDYPANFHDKLLRQHLTVGDYRMHSLMNWLAPFGCISAVAMVAIAIAFGLRDWTRTALPLCVALIVPAILLASLRPHREAKRMKRAIERAYPEFLAVLIPVGSEPRLGNWPTATG